MRGLRIQPGEPQWPVAPLLDRVWLSRIDLKQEVIDSVTALLNARRLVSEQDQSWLVLCLDEAVVNAMLHGNEGDPHLTIRVCVAEEAGRWRILIADHGTGFKPEQVPDDEDDSSILLEHGRGIRLMKEWLDDLTWYRNGAIISMSRHRSDLSVSE